MAFDPWGSGAWRVGFVLHDREPAPPCCALCPEACACSAVPPDAPSGGGSSGGGGLSCGPLGGRGGWCGRAACVLVDLVSGQCVASAAVTGAAVCIAVGATVANAATAAFGSETARRWRLKAVSALPPRLRPLLRQTGAEEGPSPPTEEPSATVTTTTTAVLPFKTSFEEPPQAVEAAVETAVEAAAHAAAASRAEEITSRRGAVLGLRRDPRGVGWALARSSRRRGGEAFLALTRRLLRSLDGAWRCAETLTAAAWRPACGLGGRVAPLEPRLAARASAAVSPVAAEARAQQLRLLLALQHSHDLFAAEAGGGGSSDEDEYGAAFGRSSARMPHVGSSRGCCWPGTLPFSGVAASWEAALHCGRGDDFDPMFHASSSSAGACSGAPWGPPLAPLLVSASDLLLRKTLAPAAAAVAAAASWELRGGFPGAQGAAAFSGAEAPFGLAGAAARRLTCGLLGLSLALGLHVGLVAWVRPPRHGLLVHWP